MSLMTQCPECALVFKVPGAQGQVRCAQCAHVFEVQAYAVTAPVLEVSSASDAELLSHAPRVDLDALLRREDIPSEPTAPLPASPSPVLTSAAQPVPPVTAPFTAPVPALRAIPPQAETRPPHAATRSEAVPADTVSSGSARGRRWGIRVTGWLLAVGLCWQVMVFFRDEWVAQVPTLRPVLAALCVPTQCTLSPLRRWNGIVIDSSSLAHNDEGYTLNLVLRNAVDVPLAMTAVELTLTDEQDRALMRRVLRPADLGAPEVLAAGQVWERVLRVEPLPPETEIAGYRLVSFYP